VKKWVFVLAIAIAVCLAINVTLRFVFGVETPSALAGLLGALAGLVALNMGAKEERNG
jgi:TRAP-type C4-dicarboxylate transport system permease small subunit